MSRPREARARLGRFCATWRLWRRIRRPGDFAPIWEALLVARDGLDGIPMARQLRERFDAWVESRGQDTLPAGGAVDTAVATAMKLLRPGDLDAGEIVPRTSRVVQAQPPVVRKGGVR